MGSWFNWIFGIVLLILIIWVSLKVILPMFFGINIAFLNF